MNDKRNSARKTRKLQASRDRWKQRSTAKQEEIRQLRVTVRDLSNSRGYWKSRVQELEQQLQTGQEVDGVNGLGGWIFLGGYMDKQTIVRMLRTASPLSSE